MAVYSYCIVWAHERERLYEPTTLVEQTMQRKGSKHILFKRFECSSFKVVPDSPAYVQKCFIF